MALTDSQIATVAYNAGWRGNELVTAIAVSRAESSGNPSIRNSIGASGLWQILQSAHPEFSSQWQTGAWKDPATNAKMGYSVYQAAGNSWRPWEAYTNGSYRAFLPGAMVAAHNVDPTASVTNTDATFASSTTTTSSGSLAGFGSAVSFLTDPHTWFRIAEFVLGVILTMHGISILSGLKPVIDNLKAKGIQAGTTIAATAG